jgi:hypothetical protein
VHCRDAALEETSFGGRAFRIGGSFHDNIRTTRGGGGSNGNSFFTRGGSAVDSRDGWTHDSGRRGDDRGGFGARGTIADDYFGAIAQPITVPGALGSSTLLGSSSSIVARKSAPALGQDVQAPSEDSDADRAEYLKELEQIKQESEAKEHEKEKEAEGASTAEAGESDVVSEAASTGPEAQVVYHLLSD